MDSEQLEVMINELEQNSERLRALYDQYFMGIEKIEPAVLKKTVERQIYILRREQIRNTGLRFKLNTIIQRLNTYQQYWLRICREIENGTYKRDLRRAAKRFGEDAVVGPKKKSKSLLSPDEQAEQARAQQAARDEGFDVDVDVDLDEAPHNDRASILDNLALEDDHDLGAPKKKIEGPVRLRNLTWSLDDLDNVDDFGPPPPKQPSAPELIKPEPAPPPQKPRYSLDDLDNIDDFGPPPPPKPAPAPQPQAPSAGPTFGRSFQQPARAPVPSPSAPNAPARSVPPPRPAVQPAQPLPKPPLAPPTPAARPAPVAAAQPRPPQPQQRPAAPAPPVVQRPAASSASDSAALSDARVRQIYDKYVQAKRDCKESTSGITADSLATSLRDSAKKLTAKHAGKNVDFDVVIKDGKAVLKPVIKS